MNLRLRNELGTILHLSLLQRLLHIRARVPLLGFAAGMIIMTIGMAMLQVKPKYLPESVWASFGGLIHTFGAIPFVKYVEPVWAIFAAGLEEEL